MNDVPGGYNDNRGAITASWLMEYSYEVELPNSNGKTYVSAKEGLDFTNKSDRTIRVIFSATDTWLNGIDANGKPVDKPMILTNANYGALIGRFPSGKTFLMGTSHNVILKPNEGFKLLANDCEGCYGDNTGSLTVRWNATSYTP